MAEIKKAKAEQEQLVASRGTGLNRNSFGALNPERVNSPVGLVFVSQCTGNNNQSNPGTEQLAEKISESIMDLLPAKGMMDSVGQVTDQTLDKERLDHFFTYYRGEKHPLVRVIYRDDHSIDFWFDGAFLRFKEADAAAREYCGYNKKLAVFAGYKEMCGKEIKLPHIRLIDPQNQEIHMRESDVIVAYNCN
jgi:hypothetical protein